jgi:hypothetical protein
VIDVMLGKRSLITDELGDCGRDQRPKLIDTAEVRKKIPVSALDVHYALMGYERLVKSKAASAPFSL